MAFNFQEARGVNDLRSDGVSLHETECLELGLDPKTSPFALKCVKLGLDPKKTSIHALECIKLGLDPEQTSSFELECVKQGKDPKKASLRDVGMDSGSTLRRRRRQW